ncbi:MAG: VOC family protein [Acidobacteriota bacterium]|nr:VOC family protein [Acidobacteriota bacterium]
MKKALFLLLAAALVLPTSLQLGAQQRPAITGIAYVRVYATSQDASAKFYDGILGYPRHRVGTEDFYSVSDSQWLQVAPLPAGGSPSFLAAIALTTRNERGMEAYLKAHGQKILPQKEKDRFGVLDPEGNLILFVQQGAKHPGMAESAPRAVSHRIIHAGFVTHDANAENAFYRDLLGFRPYWHGGGKSDTATDYMSQQVPEGKDWIEYMLNVRPNPDQHLKGVMNHFSLGVTHMDAAVAQLQANHCTDASCTKSQMGRDGKVQLNLYDPDQTRAELMEFTPVREPCCSPYTGPQPTEVEDR